MIGIRKPLIDTRFEAIEKLLAVNALLYPISGSPLLGF
jgi:hypothetical protein